ncbi:hypothetical protein DPEC_G00270620 [Dallia pectoralis]|uniref:Uncharacterized protein n=1 Tax=Dallia pectoralis TaxID=75939 RepID=A0ACC2FPF9_DALPE|nr:hypothetical protein DPEC_G00270620 [Dallia pectoralis]
MICFRLYLRSKVDICLAWILEVRQPNRLSGIRLYQATNRGPWRKNVLFCFSLAAPIRNLQPPAIVFKSSWHLTLFAF